MQLYCWTLIANQDPSHPVNITHPDQILIKLERKYLEVTISHSQPTCLYDGCNPIRSLGTGHFGLGFLGRAKVSRVCITYNLPHPGKVHPSLSKATQSRHKRCLHGAITGNTYICETIF